MDYKTTLSSFESAAKSAGIDPSILPGVEGLPEGHGKAVIAAYKLFIISQAAWSLANQVIDWNDYSQRKFYPWFDLENYDEVRVGSASGFSYGVFGFVNSASGVGSRLVFPSREIASFIGETHINIYRDLMVQE